MADDSTAELRPQALVDTRQLAERAGRLKSEIKELEKDRARYEQELEDFRVTVAWTG
ncbi:MAG TPA: hypothetical protein PKL49_09270 [Steroidobacteraceae bacterium]|nr:hypothetical protein [Steroidobacteraceae bacterium]HNS26529.1 hypothetical protein [Steroidobacteraceae bacterium]